MTVTVVTGAAGGIGSAVAGHLAELGHRIIGVDVVATDSDGDRIAADLSCKDGISDLRTGLARLGVTAIDHLIHCAAVGQWSSLEETTREDWERIIRINLFGAIGITQEIAPNIEAGGSVILFGSGTVFKGPANMSAYVASKAGVIGFARSMAAELGDRGITVNVVCPGYTETAMVEQIAHTREANIATRAIKRDAVPADIVGTVEFLVSPQSRFLTGQAITVDGGSVRR